MLAWMGWYPLLLTWCQLPMLQPDGYLWTVCTCMCGCFPTELLPFALSSALDHPTSLGTGLWLVIFYLHKTWGVRGGVAGEDIIQ